MKKMTNEEKAKQICCSDCVFVNKGLKWCTPCTGAKVGIPKMVEMAEWKDKAFLSIIEAKLNYARDMIPR